jgi:hypothetical protein
MTSQTAYRYPDPLTPKALRSLMDDPRYWNRKHLENDAYVAFVSEGYKKLYPGKYQPGSDPVLEAGGPGLVHVRSYERRVNGHAVQVAEHDRGGAGQSSVDASPNAKADLPKMQSPVPNPKVREEDGHGNGHYGANREGRKHTGIDLVTTPGQTVTSPVTGRVETRPSNNGHNNNGEWIEPYPNDAEKRGKLKGVDHVPWRGVRGAMVVALSGKA